MTQHKHAALIKQWADDTSLIVEYKNVYGWIRIDEPAWCEDFEYRIADPYLELKEAYARGEVIQNRLNSGDDWVDHVSKPAWTMPVEHYRIKPRTKKVKYCAFEFSDGCVTWSREGSASYHGRMDNETKRIPELDKEVEL